MSGKGSLGILPSRTSASQLPTPAAFTRTSSCPAAGSGRGKSSFVITFGGPNRRIRTVFICPPQDHRRVHTGDWGEGQSEGLPFARIEFASLDSPFNAVRIAVRADRDAGESLLCCLSSASSGKRFLKRMSAITSTTTTKTNARIVHAVVIAFSSYLALAPVPFPRRTG